MRLSRITGSTAVFAVLSAIAGAGSVSAAPLDAKPEEIQNAGVDEHLDQQIPLDAVFRNEEGRVVRLREVFNGDLPVILSLNYSNCPMLCSLQLTGLTNSLKQLEWSAGKEFRVVSVSIDPSEQPHRALETRQKYLRLYGRGSSGWQFLVGKQSSIDQVTDAVGFRYQFVPERNEYAHPAVAVLCTPDGRISRYLYGIDFPEQTMRLSLVEASEGKIGDSGDQLLLFCFHYDPATGTYAPRAARLAMSVGGCFTVLVLSGGILMLRSRERASSLSEVAGASDLHHHVSADPALRGE